MKEAQILKKLNFLKLAKTAAQIASDKKSSDIKILNVRRLTAMTDYFVIVSVESNPQINAVMKEIQKIFLEKEGCLPAHCEGRGSSSWSVLDYGGLVIHIMHSDTRDLYALDKIWADGRKIKLGSPKAT